MCIILIIYLVINALYIVFIFNEMHGQEYAY